MPWRETSAMDERLQFVQDVHRPGWSIAELCRRYAVSRKTGYKWLRAYERAGSAGLMDGSHRPHTCPQATPPTVVRLILDLQRRYTWGARKVRRLLQARVPADQVPTKTTIHRILERHGRVRPRRRSHRRFHAGPPGTPMEQPNAVWTADFKGQFKTLDGLYCYPLTVADSYSRYLLTCRSQLSVETLPTKKNFQRLFLEYGIPSVIRTDNGIPFAAPTAIARISRLSAWWIRLGIRPELIKPSHPEQNGSHERMHKTLKAETTRPPAGNATAQQRRFDAFRSEYNQERPHEKLDDKTPAELYCPSPRPFPKRLPEPEYPGHFEVRKVSRNGGIRWKKGWVNISHSLLEQNVGLEEIHDGVWSLYFGPLLLGRFHEDDLSLHGARPV